MGCRNMDSLAEDHTPPSLSEALLFTTMCIVGLPVEVLVKDGSVYSGIFHTASVDSDYGIVLKKARMTKKGKGNPNVGNEGLVDTLVILSDDLVQVVAMGVMLPADGIGGTITGDGEEAVVHNFCSENLTCDVENHTRQAGDDKPKGKGDVCREKSEFVNGKIGQKVQSLDSSHGTDACHVQGELIDHVSADTTSRPADNGLCCNNAPTSVKSDDRCSERSTSADSASTNSIQGVDLISDSHNLPARSIEISDPRGRGSMRNSKEFKLNPAAKTFSPSFVNSVSATPAATMVYVPNSSPSVSVPEVGFNTFASRPSAPLKVAQYSNLTVANGSSGSQFTQPIVGQLAHRTQPLRYATQYAPVLSEPAYLQPSSPAVMVGRSPQLVYVQPVSHDLIHGATAISPVSARPMLNHVQFPKQQGGTVGQAMPVCVPPPVLTSGPQHFAIQSHIPLLQPGFPVTRPISVPGPNGFYGTKF